MSQSEVHKNLVKGVMKALENRYPGISITADLQQNPGDEVPPTIDGFRPDVYANWKRGNLSIIAEAKTDNDIDNQHAWDQATSFINYLNHKKTSLFILAVTGQGADLAKTFLRFVSMEFKDVGTKIKIFDSHDFWLLDSKEGLNWHLFLENRQV